MQKSTIDRNFSLWLDYDKYVFRSKNKEKYRLEDFFIVELPKGQTFVRDDGETGEGEETVCGFWIDDIEKHADEAFCAWYKTSGYGYVFLESDFFDIAPYVVTR